MQQRLKKRLEAIAKKRPPLNPPDIIITIVNAERSKPPLTRLYYGNHEWFIKPGESEKEFSERAFAECKKITGTRFSACLIAG